MVHRSPEPEGNTFAVCAGVAGVGAKSLRKRRVAALESGSAPKKEGESAKKKNKSFPPDTSLSCIALVQRAEVSLT